MPAPQGGRCRKRPGWVWGDTCGQPMQVMIPCMPHSVGWEFTYTDWLAPAPAPILHADAAPVALQLVAGQAGVVTAGIHLHARRARVGAPQHRWQHVAPDFWDGDSEERRGAAAGRLGGQSTRDWPPWVPGGCRHGEGRGTHVGSTTSPTSGGWAGTGQRRDPPGGTRGRSSARSVSPGCCGRSCPGGSSKRPLRGGC